MIHPELQPAPTPQESESWKEHSTGFSSVSVFLSDDKGRLLMVQDLDKYGGKWSPIAGYIDDLDHEEPEMAALREAKEELGLDIRLDNLLGVWHYYDSQNGDRDRVHIHVGYAYTGTILSGTFIKQLEEIQNFKFFTAEEVESMHQRNLLKTPEYNYKGFQLWLEGARHPRTIIQTNGNADRR